MYCPKCKGEFPEGIIHCNTCDVFLVHDLPKKKVVISKLMGFDVERILKGGGLILISLQVVLTVFYVTNVSFNGPLFVVTELCKGILSGLLFYGVGQMIGILKEREHHED